jgi:hypothetical protein
LDYTKIYTDNGIKAVVTGTHVIETSGAVKTLSGKPVYQFKSWIRTGSSLGLPKLSFLNPSLDPPAALYTHTDPLISDKASQRDGLLRFRLKIWHSDDSRYYHCKEQTVEGFPTGEERNSSLSISIPQFVDSLKEYANFSNDSSLNHPSWGETTTDVPVMPVNSNLTPSIVYFDSSVVGNPVKLTSEQGTGILLVKGNLELMGEFRWYGIVAVTGSIKFTGNGNMNITGGVLSGSDVIDEAWINGGVKIYYCSTVKDYLNKIPKTHKKRWHEIF